MEEFLVFFFFLKSCSIHSLYQIFKIHKNKYRINKRKKISLKLPFWWNFVFCYKIKKKQKKYFNNIQLVRIDFSNSIVRNQILSLCIFFIFIFFVPAKNNTIYQLVPSHLLYSFPIDLFAWLYLMMVEVVLVQTP